MSHLYPLCQRRGLLWFNFVRSTVPVQPKDEKNSLHHRRNSPSVWSLSNGVKRHMSELRWIGHAAVAIQNICKILRETSTATNIPSLDQIASQLLLTLYGLKQRFEIAGPKTREVVPLDNLDENGRAVHQMLIHLVSIRSQQFLLLGFTLVKSCKRYPPSSKSMRISRLLSVSKSSFSDMPCLFSLNFMFS